MIYCGYQGVGKSTYCRNNPNTTVDLDSSNFKKINGWEREYIKLAVEYSNCGKNVFISAHKCVIEFLIENSIDFSILAPILDRETWLLRLKFRYAKNPILPNLKAIKDFENNFESDMEYYHSLEDKGISVKWINAKIITTIGDFIN